RLRCPNCGGGPLFKNWLRMQLRCPTCGMRLERGEAGYQVGASGTDGSEVVRRRRWRWRSTAAGGSVRDAEVQAVQGARELARLADDWTQGLDHLDDSSIRRRLGS